MQIESKTVELRILKAGEDMVLTNGENFSDIGGEVYLGVNDSPDNWREITQEEFEQMQKEIENNNPNVEENFD